MPSFIDYVVPSFNGGSWGNQDLFFHIGKPKYFSSTNCLLCFRILCTVSDQSTYPGITAFLGQSCL